MLALVLDGEVRLVPDFPEPARAPGEALLSLRLAGICDTDLQLARGYLPFSGVLGHEFVATVLEADDPAWLGRRVIGDINAGCGRCTECLLHGSHHCHARTVLGISGRNGVLADRFCLPLACLSEVPEHVPDECAVFAEPLAAALHVCDAVSELPSEAAVLGDGKLGALIGLVLHTRGVAVTQIGHHPEKLARVAALGLRTCLESELDNRRFPLVVEASGSHAGLARALTLTAPRGHLCLKTTVAGTIPVDLTPVVVDELTLVGSRCGDPRQALECLAAGRIDPRPFISARYSLNEAERAFAHARQPGVMKVLVSP